MEIKHYLNSLCEKVCPDQLLSGVKETKKSQGESKDKVLLESEN